MADYSTANPVVVLARPHTDLVESIRREFDRSSIPSSLVSIEDTSTPDATGPVVVVVDSDIMRQLLARRGLWWAKRRVRHWEEHICELVFQIMAGAEDRRLLVVCDARTTSDSDSRRSIRWARQLALRIRYECAINGLDNVTAMYKVVVDGAGVPSVATSIARWCVETATLTPPTAAVRSPRAAVASRSFRYRLPRYRPIASATG